MKWTFHKDGYNYSVTEESGRKQQITNTSSFKWLRNVVNLVIADIGYTYSLTWNDITYKVTPTFGGYGYKVKDENGNVVGKLKCGSNSTVLITSNNTDLIIMEESDSNYIVKSKELAICNISTSGSSLNPCPVQMTLHASNNNVLPLLAFFGVLKCA